MSCLGPLSFLLFINDVPLVLHDSNATLYADDTSVAYASNSVEDITKSMNVELENLRKWLHANWLQSTVAKTTPTIIGTKKTASKQQRKAYTGTFQNIRRSNREENICKVSRSHFG